MMTRHIHVHMHTFDTAEFEAQHPRGEHGMFGEGQHAAEEKQHTKRRVKVPDEGTHTEITWPDGSIDRIQRLNSRETMGLPGWHNIGGQQGRQTGTYLDDTEEGAIKELKRLRAKAAAKK